MIHVGTGGDQESTQVDMAEEYRPVEIQIDPKRRQGLTVREQKLDGAYISIVRAPFHERHAARVYRRRRVSGSHVIEHEVGVPLGDSLEHLRLRLHQPDDGRSTMDDAT